MKRIFVGNTVLKISSVLIAIALWIFINSRGVSEISVTVPLEIKNLSSGFEIVTSKTNEISLGLKGHERLIKALRIQDIRVYIDMSKTQDGWNVYYINRESIRVPQSVSVTKIDPSVIKIKVDRTVKREVAVKPVIHGKVQQDYRIAEITAEPPRVAIEGASSVVKKMNNVNTESIDVSNRRDSFSKDVKIVTNGKNIRLSKDTIRVNINIVGREK